MHNSSCLQVDIVLSKTLEVFGYSSSYTALKFMQFMNSYDRPTMYQFFSLQAMCK